MGTFRKLQILRSLKEPELDLSEGAEGVDTNINREVRIYLFVYFRKCTYGLTESHISSRLGTAR